MAITPLSKTPNVDSSVSKSLWDWLVKATGVINQLITLANGNIKLVAVPASATAAGSPGEIAYDSTHFYVCVAADTWRRTNLSAW